MENERQDIINSLKSKAYDFTELALRIFHYQKTHNEVYRLFIERMHLLDTHPSRMDEIPFLPVQLFKYHIVRSGDWKAERIFLSSGTTGTQSRHCVRSVKWYLENARTIFESHYGPLSQYKILALLPHYYDNPSSSLLTMVDYFMTLSRPVRKDYFIDDYPALHDAIEDHKVKGDKTLLFGVSFALLDYLQTNQHDDVRQLTVIETGGMKRYRKEMTRSALHNALRTGFRGAQIHSEYGMTECLSQLYSLGNGQFEQNHRMQVLIGDPTDPKMVNQDGSIGQIQLVDLANLDTVSFIRTDDLGFIDESKRVSVMGRISNSDLRGCNYLI